MKLLRKWIIINFFLIFQTSLSESSINLQTGTYEISHLDFIVVNSQTDLRVQRSYSSRRVQKGWWGWSWCTTLEAKISVQKGKVVYSNCEGEHEFTRFNNIWISSSLPGYEISYKNSIYKIKILDEAEMVFNNAGEMISWTDRAKRRVEINREVTWLGGHKIVLSTQDNFEVHLEFNSEGLVSKIKIKSLNYLSLFRNFQFLRPKMVEFKYFYQDGNLIQVSEGENKFYVYRYSGTRNLVVWENEKRLGAEIIYDESEDLVLKIKTHEGCVEEANYRWDSSKKQVVQFKYSCNGALKKIANYIFNYDYLKPRVKYLKGFQIESENSSLISEVNPVTGNIIDRRISNHEKK